MAVVPPPGAAAGRFLSPKKRLALLFTNQWRFAAALGEAAGCPTQITAPASLSLPPLF